MDEGERSVGAQNNDRLRALCREQDVVCSVADDCRLILLVPSLRAFNEGQSPGNRTCLTIDASAKLLCKEFPSSLRSVVGFFGAIFSLYSTTIDCLHLLPPFPPKLRVLARWRCFQGRNIWIKRLPSR